MVWRTSAASAKPPRPESRPNAGCEQAELREGEKAESVRRLRRRLWVMIGVMTAAFVAAGIATYFWHDATQKSKISETRRLVAISAAERDKHLDLSLLLAMEALRIEDTTEARNSLFQALLARPQLASFLHAQEGDIGSVAFSPDGDLGRGVPRPRE